MYLVTEAKESAQESRNVIRLLHLIEKTLPNANHYGHELAEISEALMWGAQVQLESGVGIRNMTLRHWYAKFINGDTEMWDVEIENS